MLKVLKMLLWLFLLVSHVTAELLKSEIPDVEVSFGSATSVSKKSVSANLAYWVCL